MLSFIQFLVLAGAICCVAQQGTGTTGTSATATATTSTQGRSPPPSVPPGSAKKDSQAPTPSSPKDTSKTANQATNTDKAKGTRGGATTGQGPKGSSPPPEPSGPQPGPGRSVDSEGTALSPMSTYVDYVKKGCGDPAKVKAGDCLALKNKLCGSRDTSEVLCLPSESGSPEARFRSASRYTRVGYLRCSLTQLKCNSDPETYTGQVSLDPVSLAAWVEYTSKCTDNAYDRKTTSPATCASLSGAHCSRPDVKCGKDAAEFLDLGSKKAVARGDYSRGLMFWK